MEVDGSGGDHASVDEMEEKWCAEEGYFGSYTHFKIHEEMLKVRMISDRS